MVYPIAALNGELVPHKELWIHAESLAMRYGLAVFEGVRAYLKENGRVAYFELDAHLDRLQESAGHLGFGPIDLAAVAETAEALLAANEVSEDCYLRIAANAINQGTLGSPMEAGIFASVRPMGRKKWLEQDIRQSVRLSKFRRPGDLVFPQSVKCIANYAAARLALMDALSEGFDNVLIGTETGTVAEAPTANFFFARDGVLHTPAADQCILNGITRRTILSICDELAIECCEGAYSKEDVLGCDEAFLCGTGLEFAAIDRIDDRRMPDANPIARRIVASFFLRVR